MTQPMRILIADDSASLARSLSLVLRRRGHETEIARDGLEAVELALAQRFDVILLDIKMPNLDGVEAFRRIHAAQPDAVVLMMSAYAVGDLVQDVLSAGVYRVLRKPVELTQLIQLIERAGGDYAGPTVLLVDDHDGSRTMLERILSRRGCTVHTADTGEKAIALASEHAFDLLFVDMKLPTIDGLETCLALNALQPRPPAVVMTAYWDETGDRVKAALGCCAKACLRKPLEIEEVLRLVEELAEPHLPRSAS
jgi:CheY-like chemotaxis protein